MKFTSLLFVIAATAFAADPAEPPLKDLDGDFSWTPSPTAAAWAPRAEQVRMQMRVSLGIWPEPTRTPLNAVVHGKIERDDYTIEKVYFESMPGFFVTGSLFRPKTATGKMPAVLCPHGHWADARFMAKGDAEIKAEIARGEERFERGGRSMFQSLGVQLARMGCVAFVIDMLGDSDSQQIPPALSHKFGKQRPEMISPEPGGWGLYSPQAESHAQSIMGLQTWNNIRALDFLTSLPDVDPARLACTGASGGGTQTMILAALDPRLAVAVPCVMVSTAMQGGCTCENASGLRVGTGNIEFAALFAPKPMGLTTAKDWTIDLPTKGFPDLQKHWAMLGAPDHVKLWAHPEFGHNYNIVTREHIYGFFNEHFKLGLTGERLVERDYEPVTREQLTVYDTAHPAPAGGPDFEKKLLRWWYEDAKQQMEKDAPAFRKIASAALPALLPTQPTPVSPLAKPATYIIIVRDDAGDETLTRALTSAGFSVWDEHLKMPAATPKVKNPREAAAFTFGYNSPLFAQNVQQVLGALGRLGGEGKRRFAMIGLGSASSAVVAAAAARSSDTLEAVVLDTGGFRFQNVRDIRDPMFLPGGAKYGDLPGLLALGAPRKLFLMGEGAHAPDLVTAAYAGTPAALHVGEKRDVDAAVKWLIETLR